MRKLVAGLMAGAILVVALPAFAQDGETRSRFYDFENMVIDGEFKAPDLLRGEARDSAQFQRLLQLRKSFMPKIQESTEEAALQ